LLAERGSQDAVSIRDVADRVGVSSPAIYLHFTDKDHLFYECCSRVWARFAVELAPALTAAGSPISRIRRLGEAYVAFGMTHPEQYKVLFSGTPPKMAEEGLTDDPGFQVLLGLISLVGEGIAAGEIRADLAPADTAVTLWATVHGLVEILLHRRALPALVPVEDETSAIATALDLMSTGIATP
jgi:AcrR family transcriptional regulator